MQRKKRKRKSKSKGRLKSLFACVTSILLAICVSFNLYLSTLSPIKNLENFQPTQVSIIYSADGEIIRNFSAYNSATTDLDSIPEYLKKGVIATEDKNFYRHRGFDLFGLARSILVNIQKGQMAQGASTITQQLARILFLSNERTFDRKIKEFIIAHRIEKSIDKDKILEMYLNNIYLGSGAYGVKAATQVYFGKQMRDLTLAECALIAGLPQAPSIYSPFNNPDLAIKRRNKVLSRMYKERYITKQQYQEAKEETLKLNRDYDITLFNKAPYFIDYVLARLASLGFTEKEISQGGYKIITTLDLKKQNAANEALRSGLINAGLNNDNQQAALFSIDPHTGKILAYIGGKNFSKSQFDRITQAVRPPGSSFKPFVYVAALERGLSPNDIIVDLPVKIGNWTPRNYGNTYRIELPLYAGLMYSSNVIAARLAQEVGLRAIINTAKMLGITTSMEYDYTIALGSNGVKLFDMTVAYACFANGGYKVKPYAIERIENSRGNVVYEASEQKKINVLNYEIAATITRMLQKVIQAGTGTAANIPIAAAGKTGTTDDSKDSWFLGYTPDIVTGVWVGNDNNVKLPANITGGTTPAVIWRNYMREAVKDAPRTDFDYPDVEFVKTVFHKKYLIKQDQKVLSLDLDNPDDLLLYKNRSELEFLKNLQIVTKGKPVKKNGEESKSIASEIESAFEKEPFPPMPPSNLEQSNTNLVPVVDKPIFQQNKPIEQPLPVKTVQ